MSLKPESLPEFSRPVPRERLGGQVMVQEIAATPEERVALARRFGLLGLDLLTATLRIEAGPGPGSSPNPGSGLLRLEGHLSAEVTQACVVTLEPVTGRIEADFVLDYSLEPEPAPAGAPGGGPGGGPGDGQAAGVVEVVFDPEAAEPPVHLGPGGLDLGEAVAQHLAVALEPYPRAAGAEFDRDGPAAGAEKTATGPFAALEALKRPG
jgi:hypothetical protein